MATAKKDLFDIELQRNAALFKALSHPARLAILRYLSEIKSCITGNISEEIPLSRTTVNQHLAELKKVGLIKGSIDGVKTNYCINQDNLKQLSKVLNEFVDSIHTEEKHCE